MQGFLSNVSPSNSSSLFEHGSNVLWIQLFMAVLSIVGSGSIIVFAIFQNLRRTAEERALFILSVADLMLCFTWLIGAVLLKQTCDNRDACYNLHAVEQMLYMSSFFYTLNYTWALCKGLKEEYRTGMTDHSKTW
ncbi:hypothetical protein AGOR_G00244900 [Albula goreensis]|uniref:Uncharacterized protein n=1 Tax=Albula goreensis TaxID=1534307 RepID=A0A8T3CAJ0_9TELE|nr:hypothetical protein AGOR_G00244900 [Albula goreensis]